MSVQDRIRKMLRPLMDGSIEDDLVDGISSFTETERMLAIDEFIGFVEKRERLAVRVADILAEEADEFLLQQSAEELG